MHVSVFDQNRSQDKRWVHCQGLSAQAATHAEEEENY